MVSFIFGTIYVYCNQNRNKVAIANEVHVTNCASQLRINVQYAFELRNKLVRKY